MRAVIMCKAPVAGRVKTRLQPEYTPEAAARLHAAMAETVIRRARHVFGDVVVAADDPTHPFFAALAVAVVPQGEGSLGERMARLLVRLWNAEDGGMVFLGTDSPHMPDNRLQAAVDLAATHDVVFGPVEDGGYDLIALAGPLAGLFADIDWGTPAVLRQSLERAAALSLHVGMLELSFDVDSAADLRRAIEAGWPCPAGLADDSGLTSRR
ncbi:MAG TPA: TIGR04282 family arsenosugar biosynthesis glycosyltransferase [Mariprofundaceae bacterium]|nr:TIGR04282 family arsenosugar biosynthesis glycosyltransferase [Mariprofundaceae bacterium]